MGFSRAAFEPRRSVSRTREKPQGTSGYLVSHSRTPYLFGPDGQPVALVPVDDPGTPDQDEGAPDKVLAFLEKWVK